MIQYIIMMLSYRNGWWWKWKRNFSVAVGQSSCVLKWRFLASNHLHLLSGRTGLAAAPICLRWVHSQVEVHAILSNSSLYTTFLPLKFAPAVKGKKKIVLHKNLSSSQHLDINSDFYSLFSCKKQASMSVSTWSTAAGAAINRSKTYIRTILLKVFHHYLCLNFCGFKELLAYLSVRDCKSSR